MSKEEPEVEIMFEPLKFDGAGPAYIIVPLSESMSDRLLFNDLVDFTEGGRTLTTKEELMRIWDLQANLYEFMRTDSIGQTPLPDPWEPENREIFRKFHKELYEKYQKLHGGH